MYPALAVARALRDARSDVELDYVGGVRGFERRIVADHPMRGELRYHELVVRSLRSAGPLAAHRGRSGAPRRQRPAGVVAPRPPSPRRAVHDRRLPGPAARPRRARARHPDPRLGGQRPARAARRGRSAASRPAWRSASRRPSRPSPATGSSPAPRSAPSPRSTATPHAAPSASDPDDRLLLVFGGSQAVTRFNAAVTDALPRLLTDWHVLHLAGEAGMADAGAARQRLPAELRSRYTAEPFLTDRMADALVAVRPRRRPCGLVDLRGAGGGRRGLDPRAVPVRRRPPALQRLLPRRRGRGAGRRRRGSRRRPAGGRGLRAARRRPARRDGRGRAASRPPGRGASRWPTSCWRSPSGVRCPRRRPHERRRGRCPRPPRRAGRRARRRAAA